MTLKYWGGSLIIGLWRLRRVYLLKEIVLCLIRIFTPRNGFYFSFTMSAIKGVVVLPCLLSKDQYNTLLNNSITSTYKQSKNSIKKKINFSGRKILKDNAWTLMVRAIISSH